MVTMNVDLLNQRLMNHMFGSVEFINSSFKDNLFKDNSFKDTLINGNLPKRRKSYVYATKRQRAFLKKRYNILINLINLNKLNNSIETEIIINNLIIEMNKIDNVIITKKYIMGWIKNAKRRL